MNRLKRMLPEAVAQTEALRTARARRTLRNWSAIVGEDLARRSQPDRYDKGTVWVAVAGSAWAQELRMTKDGILSRLRAASGEPALFTDLRFGVRPFETPAPEPELVEEPLADLSELSIQEIARRRREIWRNEGRT